MFKDLVAIKPYYVVPKKYSIIPQQKQETEGMKDIVALPDYKIEVPSKKLIKCLELVNNHESCRKRNGGYAKFVNIMPARKRTDKTLRIYNYLKKSQ